MAPLESNWDQIASDRAKEKRTHVSFPQLKYPSLRDSGFRDPMQWLTGKAMDDGAEGIWRIHDKLYDLTSFIKKHPGGEEWLELTKGTDVTEAFEAHHLNPATETVLNKYYARDAKTLRNSPFTFKEDGFYRTLKREVFKELPKLPKSASRTTNLITDSLFLSLLCSAAMACWITNPWFAQLWYFAASVCLSLLTIASHNFIHRKTNWRTFLFNISMWSFRDYRVSHVLSHHLYTNTLMDFEMSAMEPILVFNPRKDKPLYARLGFMTEFVFFPFIFVLIFAKRLIAMFIKEGYFKNHYRWHDGLGFILPLWMWVVTDSPPLKVLYIWLWILCTGSLFFFLIGINAAHHHPEAMKDGDQPRDENPDWGAHQVEALLDRKDINGNTFAVVTLFGEHALHHLFPTLDHAVLKYLHPTFINICEKFKLNYRMSTQFQMVLGQIEETMRTSYRTIDK